MLAFVLILTLILLARAFRSIVLPIKAAILNLVSLAAAFGIIVFIFQQGHGSSLWNITATQAITAWIPLMIFAFLFGLSMDYEVFMLTRMREAYDETGSTEKAIELGLARTGKLVTSAALILMFAFLVLSSSPGFEIKEFAIGLAAGIIFDATVIRALLVPALMRLLGRRELVDAELGGDGAVREARPAPRARPRDQLVDCSPWDAHQASQGEGRPLPGRQQSGAHVSQLGPKRPSARFGESGASRSAIASRIAETNAGCVPALAARANGEPDALGRFARLDVEVEAAPRGGRRRSRSATRRRREPAASRCGRTRRARAKEREVARCATGRRPATARLRLPRRRAAPFREAAPRTRNCAPSRSGSSAR